MLLVAAAVVVVLGAAYVAVIRPLSSIQPEPVPSISQPGAGPHRPQAAATAASASAGAAGQPPQGGPSGAAMPTGDLPGWHQTLADDFTQTALGPSWSAYDGQPDGDPGGYFLPSHVSVGGGQLTISAFKDPARGGIYATGGVSTRAAQTYGRYEVRFRMAQGKGIAYALLMWPEYNVYPPEIDFAEDNGRDRTKMYASLHPAAGGKSISRNVAGDFSQWHTAGLEWTPGKLVPHPGRPGVGADHRPRPHRGDGDGPANPGLVLRPQLGGLSRRGPPRSGLTWRSTGWSPMPGPDDTLAVLMYHSVSQVRSGPMRSLAVPAPILTEQLAALSGAGYRLTGLTEALALRRRDPSARVVALTFDDGFHDFLTTGLSILAGAGATATLYVAVGHVGEPPLWMGEHTADFDRLLTWDEVGEVASAGIEIGNHSFTHTPMDVMSPDTMDSEVRESAATLRDRTQAPVLSFAYPHGYNNDKVRSTVARYGHQTACEVGHGLYHVDGKSLAIPRLQVTASHTGDDVLNLVRTGGSRVVPALKNAARPGWWAVRKVAKEVFGWTLT